MLTIGALARLAGTTARAVRHYHDVGVLPEPARRGNGYREYDLRDAVRLVRARRLVGLGMSLPEVAGVLGSDALGPEGAQLRVMLEELDADLAGQQRALRQRRQVLAELLARPADLAASGEVADLLREVSSAAPTATAQELTRERELLEMIEATSGPERFAEVAAQYRQALADPEQLARMSALAARFEALAGLDAADPRVTEVAGELAGVQQLPEGTDGDGWQPAWQAFLATLPPAQRRCMELGLELRDGGRA